MSDKCEACGLHPLTEGKYKQVRTTNGSLFLCEQCLGDINRKNPRVAELEAERTSLGKSTSGREDEGRGNPAPESAVSWVEDVIREAVDAALEEAAKIADEHCRLWRGVNGSGISSVIEMNAVPDAEPVHNGNVVQVAVAIRALKSTST